MSTDIQYAGVFLKDLNGNVGHVRGLTENDIANFEIVQSIASSANSNAAKAYSKAEDAITASTANTQAILSNSTNIATNTAHLATVVDSKTGIPIHASEIQFGVTKVATAEEIAAGTKSSVIDAAGLKTQLDPLRTSMSKLIDSTSGDPVKATEKVFGVTRLATADELTEGTATSVVTAKGLKSKLDPIEETLANLPSGLDDVASLSKTQTFTGVNTFSADVSFTSDNPPTATTMASATDYSTHLATTAWVTHYDNYRYATVAQHHNHIFRCYDLLSEGHFSDVSSILTAIRNGKFSDIYVGDYFNVTVGSSIEQFVVAGLDLYPRSDASKHNVCLVSTPTILTYEMNNTGTASGGFLGSKMYTETLPAKYTALAGTESAPFYGYILSHSERLSNTVNNDVASMAYPGWAGASSDLASTDITLNLLSDVEVFGAPICSSSCYDNATVVRLPLFMLFEPNVINMFSGHSFWLRNVSNNTSFGVASDVFTPTSGVATATHSLVYRFFVG